MNEVVVVRHGETEWSRSGRHTSRTDVALTDAGRAQAQRLRARLARFNVDRALTSPRRRATETADLAGFADAEPVDDLREWDYGQYEGRTTPDIRVERPGWDLWTDGAPQGEAVDDVAARADRVLARCEAFEGTVLLFGHAHMLRVLAARWLELDGTAGRLLVLDPGSVSVLGHEREQRVVRLWNGDA